MDTDEKLCNSIPKLIQLTTKSRDIAQIFADLLSLALTKGQVGFYFSGLLSLAKQIRQMSNSRLRLAA
jgi:hypothetical protein